MKRIAALVGIVVLTGLLAFPAPAVAFTQRAGDNVTVGESISDDLYVFGNSIDVSGDVSGDVIAFGQSVRISGAVTGDVIAAGQYVTITGDVGGSVRAAGQNVEIDSAIADDAVAAGSDVRISAEGSVGRDAVLAGNTVIVGGDVKRNVLSGGQDVRIEASVGGDVTADVEQLTIASEGSVGGDVNYYSDREARIDGQVAGETNRHEPRTNQVEYRRPSPAARAFWAVVSWVRGLVGLILFALLALLAARPVVVRAAWESWYGRPLIAGLIGLGIFAAALPVGFIVFFIGLLIGGWWIAFVWLAVLWILGLLGAVVISLAVGSWLIGMIAHRSVHPILAALLGVLVFSVVGAIPVIGWLAVFVGMLMGMGAVVLTLYASASAPVAPAAVTPQVAETPAPPPAPPV